MRVQILALQALYYNKGHNSVKLVYPAHDFESVKTSSADISYK